MYIRLAGCESTRTSQFPAKTHLVGFVVFLLFHRQKHVEAPCKRASMDKIFTGAEDEEGQILGIFWNSDLVK